MNYVDKENELEILKSHNKITEDLTSLSPVCTRQDVLEARKEVLNIEISEEVQRAIVDIVQSTRDNPITMFGASTRAALMLQKAAKSFAAVNGRSFVSEDDLKNIYPYVLTHRLKFHMGAGSPHEALESLVEPHLETLSLIHI